MPTSHAVVAAALGVAAIGVILLKRHGARKLASELGTLNLASDLSALVWAADIMSEHEATHSLSSLTLADAIRLYAQGRPKLLTRLKQLGVQPLSRRQAVANLVGKRAGLKAWRGDNIIKPSDVMPINLSYPGLVQIYSDPPIYAIPDFLPAAMCDEIIARARSDLRASHLSSNRERAFDTSKRRSRSCWFNPEELRGVSDRMRKLAPEVEDRRGAQRVLHYEQGDFFKRHMDKWLHTEELKASYDAQGKCIGDPQQITQRVCVLFCYLCDCDDGGGSTRFTEIDLAPIKPRRGLAIVHFPAAWKSLDLDLRTYHESLPVRADEKWILTTHWISRPCGYVMGSHETQALYPEHYADDDMRPQDASRLPFKGAGPVL